jgi:hypothetical protein
VPGLGPGTPVQVHERCELSRLAADDGHHQRQAQEACSDEGLRGAADAHPDGQRILHGARVDPLPHQRRPVTPRPGDLGAPPQAQQQVELLVEEFVVVGEVEAEQRKCFGERASADDELDAPTGDEVDRRELLEHAHRVGRREHRHRAAQPDLRRAGRGGREDHRRRRVVVLDPMVLTDAVGGEADPVGEPRSRSATSSPATLRPHLHC